MEYLGHTLNASGLRPSAKNVEAVLQAPELASVRELQSNLGLINFYRSFLPNLSSVLQPLHELLKREPWRWGSKDDQAFHTSKVMLTSAAVLMYYDPHLPLLMCCDASPYGVGAVLAQKLLTGEEKPIAFASRRLSAAEKTTAS